MNRHSSSPKRLLAMVAAGAALVAGSAAAQTDAMFIDATGKIGIGTNTPSEQVHVVGSAGVAKFFVQETAGGSFEALMELENQDGNVGFRLRNPSGVADFNKIGNEFRINIGLAPAEMSLFDSGNLVIRGTLTTGSLTVYPDFVFEPDYELMPLGELRQFIDDNGHLPGVTPAAEVEKAGGINISELQVQVLQKVEELTLYVLQQQQTIEEQKAVIQALAARLEAVEQH